jgi:6-oxo-cyclohex-1-ene-carbonyl-CoA hydrolase
MKKKFFWDQAKVINRHWLAANMSTEAYLGFTAFNTKKMTGQDTIDFIEYRRRLAASDAFDADFMAAVLGKPKTE